MIPANGLSKTTTRAAGVAMMAISRDDRISTRGRQSADAGSGGRLPSVRATEGDHTASAASMRDQGRA
jgi:hypothetical protein